MTTSGASGSRCGRVIVYGVQLCLLRLTGGKQRAVLSLAHKPHTV